MAGEVNETIGRYRILAQIGRGGATTVYKAHDPVLKRDVTLKVLESPEGGKAGDRLEQQFLALSQLKHPHLQSIYEVGRDGPRYFIAMELVEGQTLADEIKARQAAGNAFTLPEIADILEAVGSAIDYAREQVSSIDTIDPAQVVIDANGKPVVIDIKLATSEESGNITHTGTQLRNPAYMSPEQAYGKPADARSDVYSLGTILYELTTGSTPFEGTAFEIVMKHAGESVPPRPSQIKPNTPEHIEQVILKALNKDPADRHQTPGELARALAQALAVDSSKSSDSLKGIPLTSPASGTDEHISMSVPAQPQAPEPPAPPAPPVADYRPSEPVEVVSYLQLDAAVPKQVSLGRTFEVAVAVRQPASPVLVDEDLPVVDSGQVQVAWPQAKDRIRLRVKVSAPECEIRGDVSYSFRLYRGQDSPVFYFHLVPQQQGDLSIVVTVYQEDDWLGSTRVETIAHPQAAGELKVEVTSRRLSPDLVDKDGSLRRQLAQHHINLLKLLEDQAMYGAGEVPLHLFNQIRAEEQAIAELEAQLAALEPSGSA